MLLLFALCEFFWNESMLWYAQVPDWTKDNAAGRLALQMAGLEVFESPLHLEGGSIHADGEGYDPYMFFLVGFMIAQVCVHLCYTMLLCLCFDEVDVSL